MSIISCCISEKSDNSEVCIQKEELKEMIMHIMHHELKPDIESLVRNTVREEFRNLSNGLDRNSGYQGQTSEPRHLKLQFLKNVSLPVFTNEEIQGEGPSSIEVALIDNLNQTLVDSGPEASAKVEIVALEGDVGGTQGDDWTSEEFNKKIVREREVAYSKEKEKRREGKKPLLDGVHLRLNKGIGAIGKIKFKQYSRWMKNRKFKLGARILDSFAGVKIKEAVTNSFIVKDKRKKNKRKRGPPSLSDDVSRLKNIRKDSRRHKHLQEKNINTVQDFLIQLFRDPGHLEQILGLEANLWEDTVNHARKCAFDKKISYYYSSQQKLGVAFNVIEQEVLGLISGCKYSPIEERSEKDKADDRRLAVTAFDHWEDVLHFHDMNSLLEYVHNLPATEGTSNPPELEIPGGNCPSSQDSCLSIGSSAPGSNVENIHSPDSSSMDSLMEFVGNYFRQQKAQLSWKKLSIAVRISMKK